mgnify:CR=1 FL=1
MNRPHRWFQQSNLLHIVHESIRKYFSRHLFFLRLRLGRSFTLEYFSASDTIEPTALFHQANYRQYKLLCSSYSSAWISNQGFACKALFWRFCKMEPQHKMEAAFASISIFNTLARNTFLRVVLIFKWLLFFMKAVCQALRVTPIFHLGSWCYGPIVSAE